MRQLLVFLTLGGVLGVIAGPLLGGPGCSTPGQGPFGTGDLVVDVTIPAGSPDLGRIAFSVSREGASASSQDLPVRSPTTHASAMFVGLPAHSGYQIHVVGYSAAGAELCSASVEADVSPHIVTSVSLALTCAAGNAHVVTNFECSQIVSVTAAPTMTSVGGKIALNSAVNASDAGATTYHWGASSGTVTDPAAASTTFTCGQAGAAALQLTTTRGACVDTVAVNVNCVGRSP